MFRYVYKMIVFGILLFVIGGCASTQQADTQQMGPDQIKEKPMITAQIRPGRIYEACLATFPNKIIAYSFSASNPVNFDIHYHKGKKVFYPVFEENISSRAGELDCHKALTELTGEVSEEREVFCLMWTNPHDAYVTLDYEFSVKDIK